MLNLKTGKSVLVDGSFAPALPDTVAEKPADSPGTPAPEGRPARRADRDLRWSMPAVSGDGKYVIASARSADNKDRWHVALDPESGKARVIDLLHDDAWVREAGGGGFGGAAVEFLPDNKRIWFLSERDGWMHLYTLDVSVETATPVQLTSGKWEVAAAEIARDGRKFYLTTSEVHPGERHLYSLPLDGGARTKITAMVGSNQAEVSPDDSTLGLVFSYSTKPPEVYVMPNAVGAQPIQVTTTHDRGLASRSSGSIPRSSPSRPATVWTSTPGSLRPRWSARGATRRGLAWSSCTAPAISQNAHKYWSTYFREYMFHNLLAARGYVVLDVDYRASSGYGRDWRTAIYRTWAARTSRTSSTARSIWPRPRTGRPEAHRRLRRQLRRLHHADGDVHDAGRLRRRRRAAARHRLGALQPRLYVEHPQRARRRTPKRTASSSPIYFAEGLKGALLICHGMVDTNVHFQDSVRLAQRLIELRKENWELAAYPVENHGFTEETSWADEYKRILKLFEDNLRRKGGKASS